MKASDLLVKCLENEGVKYVFGVPGEETEDLLFSLESSSIQFIPTRHEQGAAFMANVWGRVTGKAGVCLSTLGPGATNLITGVADAYLDNAPLVAITAQAGMKRTYWESHQYLNILNIFEPITKWNSSVSKPEAIAEIVRHAFKYAEMEKPGSTHIEFSEDLADEDVDCDVIPVVPTRRPAPDHKAIKSAIELLKQAKRPIILAGNGAIRRAASKQLTQFVETHQIPVVHTFMGRGAVSDKNPCSLLSLGLGFRDYVMDAMDQADLVITVGYDITEYSPEKWNPGKNKTIIDIDFTPSEIYTHYQPAVEVVADVAATLWQLNQALADNSCQFEKMWHLPVREKILSDIESYTLKDSDTFTIPGVLNIMRRIMKDDDLLISDVGSHKMWIARNFPVYSPNRCIISNGLASMGIALPGAIAAALAMPERRIIACMGDGGFMMNSQELETAKRLGVGFVCLIFNDNDYGLISWKQKMKWGRSTGTKITNPNFKQYAESFGIDGYSPKSISELENIIKSALFNKKLCVVEVPVDISVNIELIDKLKAHNKKMAIA